MSFPDKPTYSDDSIAEAVRSPSMRRRGALDLTTTLRRLPANKRSTSV